MMTDEEVRQWLGANGWEANEVEKDGGVEAWAWTHESDDHTFTIDGDHEHKPPISDELREYVEAYNR